MNDMGKSYRGVIENAGIGILVVDRDGRIVEVNQVLLSMLGYVEGDLSQGTFEEITHPDDREVSSRNLQALMSGEISSCRFEKRKRSAGASV
jgi:PAS domain S-box-containing protein